MRPARRKTSCRAGARRQRPPSCTGCRRWEASAAAPTDGETSPRTLRNTVFTYMIGEKDLAYGRLPRCQAFEEAIRKLRVPLIHLELCPPLLHRAGTSVQELHDRVRSLGYEFRVLSPAGEPGEAMTLHDLQQVEWDDVLAVPAA